jgi:hypothetical protein
MTIKDKASDFNSRFQESFSAALDAIENLHQTVAEMPLEVLTELGYPESKADSLKDSHRNVLRVVYGGIRAIQQNLGELAVSQSGRLDALAGSFIGRGNRPAAGRPGMTVSGRKAAEKTIPDKPARKKASRKKAARKTSPKAKGKPRAGSS